MPNSPLFTPIPTVSEHVSGTTAAAASVPAPGVFDSIRKSLSLAAPVAAPASGMTFSDSSLL